jgi:cathepsin B
MGALVGLAAATHPINEDIVSDIKSKTSNWTPMEVATNPLANKSAEEIRGMLGTIIAEPFGFQQPAVSNAEVPATFDARTEWPGCVHDIRDQAQCGSCWAFGASEALSDRFCIASKGSVNVVLSPEDLVECNSTNMGCDGGYLGMAWRYLQNTGIVSDACDPYVSGGG